MNEENNKLTEKPLLNAQDTINIFKQKMASTVKRIYINSIDRDVGFREVTVREQKQLSRILIDNEDRKDIVYDAQCGIINSVALEDFDIYDASEFDKMKLLIALYQTNMFKNEIEFTCDECGQHNKYKLNFENVLRSLDAIDTSDKQITISSNDFTFNIVAGYPKVRQVSEFYRSFRHDYAKCKSTKEIQSMNTQLNVDYTFLFVKSISTVVDGQTLSFDTTRMSFKQLQDVISSMPQDVVYSDDGIVTYVAKNFIQAINDTFEKQKCSSCGKVHNSVVEDQQDFL